MKANIKSLSLLLSIICFINSAAAQSKTVDVPKLDIESYRLPNGLKVALNPDPTAPRTTVCVAYHVGSKNERAGLTGFAHFFEHMMFRGTKNVPNYDVPLRQAGGSPNAFTTEDMTVYFETIPTNYLKLALYMEAERMAFLPTALDAKKFDTEREIVKNERRQRMENVPYGLARETISSHLYPKGHPYSWSVIGTMKDLDNSDLGDLRRFFYEFYHPGNATLSIIGPFDSVQAKSWIEEYFGVLAPGPQVKEIPTVETPTVSKRITQKDQVQFPRVYWSWPTVASTHADAAPLELLGNLLGDGDASRLNRALIVDHSLATRVSASNSAREIAGVFTINAIVAPGVKPSAVETALQAEIAKVREVAPSQGEVTRAIRKDQSRSLIQLTSTSNRAFAIGMGFAQHDNPHHYQTVYRNYSSVTPADVQRVAKKYFTPEKLVLHVVPTSEGEEETPAILAGPLPTDATTPTASARDPRSGTEWEQQPSAAEYREFTPPKFETHELSNGLSLWVAPWRTLPLVSARLIVPVGGAETPDGKAGLSQLLATMWDKGTQELTSTEFAEALDGLGTSVGVGSSFSETDLGFTVVKDALPEALELVGSMVATPRMDAADFEREQSLHLSALARGPDSPSWISGRVFAGLIYGREHPYGAPTAGNKASVEGLTLEDLKGHYKKHFTPADATLIVVGDVDAESLIKQVESTFGKWQGSPAQQHAKVAPTPGDSQTVYVVDKPGAVQSIVSVGRVWRSRQDPANLAVRVGNRVLGGDYSSRINQNLREKNGFTYGAYAQFDHIRETGDWGVSSKVRADVTGAALRELMTEIENVRSTERLTAKEINTARSAILNTFPATFESPQQIAASLRTLAIHDLPKTYLQDFANDLQAVKEADVIENIATLCEPEKLVTLIVGDRKVIVPQLEEFGFKKIEFLDIDGKPVE